MLGVVGKEDVRVQQYVAHVLVAADRHRAVATRYDKLAVRYEATVLIAAINEWL
ncbi:hypothetical protein ALMP_12470 [Streptomyces sp. A012304]|nr:hypothetical protein ALMP_12470 [Streptomyces sp. A012304]